MNATSWIVTTPAAFTSGGRTKFGPQKTSSAPQNSSAGGHSTRDHTAFATRAGIRLRTTRIRGMRAGPSASTQPPRRKLIGNSVISTPSSSVTSASTIDAVVCPTPDFGPIRLVASTPMRRPSAVGSGIGSA